MEDTVQKMTFSYFKKGERKEKATDLKGFAWVESDGIDLNCTDFQGDSRLAAAPLTPGALQVSDSDLGQVLSPMKKIRQFHSSVWANLGPKDLAPKTQRLLLTNNADFKWSLILRMMSLESINELIWTYWWVAPLAAASSSDLNFQV